MPRTTIPSSNNKINGKRNTSNVWIGTTQVEEYKLIVNRRTYQFRPRTSSARYPVTISKTELTYIIGWSGSKASVTTNPQGAGWSKLVRGNGKGPPSFNRNPPPPPSSSPLRSEPLSHSIKFFSSTHNLKPKSNTQGENKKSRPLVCSC